MEARVLAVGDPTAVALGNDFIQALAQLLGRAIGPRDGVGLGDDLERGQAGRGGDRIGVERSLVRHAMLGVPNPIVAQGHHVHDVIASGHGAAGKPAGDDLGKGGQVGLYAQPLLRAAGGQAKAGDDLVEDQQHVFRAVNSRTWAANPGLSGTRPKVAPVGSMMTAAMSSCSSSNLASAAGSLAGQMRAF